MKNIDEETLLVAPKRRKLLAVHFVELSLRKIRAPGLTGIRIVIKAPDDLESSIFGTPSCSTGTTNCSQLTRD